MNTPYGDQLTKNGCNLGTSPKSPIVFTPDLQKAFESAIKETPIELLPDMINTLRNRVNNYLGEIMETERDTHKRLSEELKIKEREIERISGVISSL